MQVEVNTSNGIDNKDSLQRWTSDYLQEHLARFKQDLTSVQVQMSDENHGTRNGAGDKRCMLEARLNGREPVAVTHHADNQDLAIRGATTRLVNALEHVFGKLDRKEHRDRDTIRRDPDAVAAAEPGSLPSS